ncbi:rab geranylgeranyl transferase escort protein-like protein [Delitschia confertaspora ATCC 74209]|uniref:Rab proteins geranylgeranyltransferase n=1 Tax=Delitschia confertaspora ATCC 74209 TaxID=1513339 RepID=A0A9P4JT78_9PLEO|nr:rab geranylgeranyl transferase escort protein-like protein [Delitschia confertaspora ATCC 74209]
MDTLDGTDWDVVIVGTGIQQSLLALALSRSGKRILHVDQNEYYGGAEAAFSLQEAEEFAKKADGADGLFHISISKPEHPEVNAPLSSLSFSRAYSLALSPQIIYARSILLQYLVSSKVYKQLDFLVVGSWWVYSSGSAVPKAADQPDEDETSNRGRLFKVPSSREDIFSDQVLDFKAKRALTKFLRFVVEYEDQPEIWEEHRNKPFAAFLVEQFRVPEILHPPLLALSLTANGPNTTTTAFALSRIARHLRSIGVFGPGFGAVIPKWGGMSEITQVACRACAVGGGVYVLSKGVASLTTQPPASGTMNSQHPGVRVQLQGGELVTSGWVVGQGLRQSPFDSAVTVPSSAYSKSVTIVSSPLSSLFPPIAEEAPPPACAVVTFPSGSILLEGEGLEQHEIPPVNIFVHSADTGECAASQCILYASTSIGGQKGFQLLNAAVETLLRTVEATPTPVVLWSMRYEQSASTISNPVSSESAAQEHILSFRPASLDLAFDDEVLQQIKKVWETVSGEDVREFLTFEERDNADSDG